ncbi:MAG TPA: carboxypeptidase regulatory-like domain-containing protein [Terriglobia bacterium]|nr:carboxypeptidase regulatory-like domain-containing protein [Terriglobia bacterium]
MRVSQFAKYTLGLGAFLISLAFGPPLFAQTTSIVRGQITDPSGAAVTQATVVATPAPGQTGQTKAGVVNKDGSYEIKGLTPGTYSVSALAEGFAPFDQNVTVAEGQSQKLDIKLHIVQQVQQVNVTGEQQRLSVAPENNASSVVISGKDLEALSDDPDELQQELTALAGPSAGPSGGQIYIDGFTGGQLPPKEAILQVRINQNPFSAEWDKLGYGRIEITTKPGFSQFHGDVMADGNASAFNARSPFAVDQPPYHTEFYNGNIGGPLSKRASFFLDAFRRDIQNSSVVSAVVLGPDLTQQPYNTVVINPLTRTNISPRFDFQLGKNNVLTARYQWWEDIQDNAGIQQFSLPSQSYDSREVEHTVQISDTQVISSRTVNQTRFQYRHDTMGQVPASSDPSLNVLGAFNGGGNYTQLFANTADSYEVQNLTTTSLNKHQVVYGGRLRDNDISSSATQGFNGAFTFPSLNAYQLAETALQQCQPNCGVGVRGATQFTLTTGTPLVKVNYLDLGLYGEDTWRMRPNISLSLGLRFESQNYINDKADFAPRLGFAWGIGHGRTPKSVLRAGFGIFYDRFQQGQIEQAERFNGVNQVQYIVTNPNFYPNVPPPSDLATVNTSLPTTYRLDPNLRAPYTVQSAIGLERQITKTLTGSVTYINSHGVHQFLTNNVNAPLPGSFSSCVPPNTTGCGPTTGTYPYGQDAGYIYQFQSVGLFNENQVVTNFNLRVGAKVTAFGFYTLSYADANTGGAGSSPMNPYNIQQDYGPASFIARNQLFMGGSILLPKGFRASPFVMISSGRPFNIVLGQDVYGTGLFNVRPALAPSGAPVSTDTKYGNFYLYGTTTQQPIPPYEFFGPSQESVNMRLAKTFGFGKKAGGNGNTGGPRFYGGGRGGPGGGLGGRGLSGGAGGPGMFGGGSEGTKYSLEFSVNIRNIFNHINLGQPVSNLGSPLFGESNSVSGWTGYRRMDLMVRFSF